MDKVPGENPFLTVLFATSRRRRLPNDPSEPDLKNYFL